MSYVYAIAARNAVGEGPMAFIKKSYISVPSVPLEVTVDSDGKIIIIQWQHPEFDGGLPLTGYTILRGIDAESLDGIMTVGIVTSFTDTTVIEGDGFYYSVVAVNDKGPGEASEPAFVKVPSPGPPGVEDEISIWLMAIVIILIAIVIVGGAILVMRRGPPRDALRRGDATEREGESSGPASDRRSDDDE
jgi:hypothetical protein